eukprot:gene17946-36639_t
MTKATQAQLKATEKWRNKNPEKWKESRSMQVAKWRNENLEEARKGDCLRHKRFVIFNKGTNTREYKYSKETPVNIGGRLYGGGVQGLPKKIRGFLMKHTTDIDMKNCHPVILQFLCLKYGFKCECLTHYINNREVVLSALGGDRDEAKSRFLATINAKWESKTIKNEFFN